MYGSMYADQIEGILGDAFKTVTRPVGKAIKKITRSPAKALGSVANIAPAVALGVASGGLGGAAFAALGKKGAAEAARHAGVPKVATTAFDPSGAVTHAVAAGAHAGYQQGGIPGALRGAASGFGRGAHEVSSNPLLKATAAGLTFVLPPVGGALTAGMVATEQISKRANEAVAAADKLNSAFKHGSAPVKKAVAGVFARTAAAAKAGDADAKRALVVLGASKRALDAKKSFFVAPNGRITQGVFETPPKNHAGILGYFVRADGIVQRGLFRRVS